MFAQFFCKSYDDRLRANGENVPSLRYLKKKGNKIVSQKIKRKHDYFRHVHDIMYYYTYLDIGYMNNNHVTYKHVRKSLPITCNEA